MPLVPVYDLRENVSHIAQVQEATLHRRGFGLQPIPALFGSDEWWAALGTPRLPLHSVTGTIARVFWGSMGDWPEFVLKADDSTETTWTREGDYTRYVEGLRCEVRYVVQRSKEDGPTAKMGWPLDHNVVTKILVEESDLRSPKEPPGPAMLPIIIE
jgi:hypothetical protein